MTSEEFEDYKFENEQFMEDTVICPYCKDKLEIDPEELYKERYEEKWECPCCSRKFYLTAELQWKYTTTPIKEEIE